MKTKIYYLIYIIGLFSLWGCEDFLTRIPESSYSEAGAYQTQADFNFAIAGVYAAQQDLYQSNACWFRLMIARSDDTRNSAAYTYGIDTFSDSDDISEMANAWAKFYQIITRCNIILDKIDAISFDDENLKSYIKGEAYALRAWSYYTLGWMFGGVPLLDRQLSTEEVLAIPRSTQEETFEFAANDFKNAISLLPASWEGTDAGRVTKYAAAGVLARMYMFQSKFTDAKPYLKEIPKLDDKYPNVCGIGGTIRAALKMKNYLYPDTDKLVLTYEEIAKMLETAKDDSYSWQLAILKVVPERVFTFTPGLMILKTIMKYFDSEQVYVSKYGVREGYLLANL